MSVNFPLLNRLLSHQIIQAPMTSASLYNAGSSPLQQEKLKRDIEAYRMQDSYLRNLKEFLRSARIYNDSLSDLRGYSLAQLQAAEGMRPEYGQYASVPNAGWISSPLTSLKQMDALSPTDRLLYGQKDLKEKKSSILSQTGPVDTWKRLMKEQIADGGHPDRRQRHVNDYMNQLVAHIKKYSDAEDLEHRTDPLSLLAKTQLKGIHDRLDLLTDEKKLQEMTGVDIYDADAKKKLLYDRLLPDPLERRTGKPATLHTKPNSEIAPSLDPKKSKTWDYLSRHLLVNPYQSYRDSITGKENGDPEDFLVPYYGLNPFAKKWLAQHRQRLQTLVTKNPEFMSQKVEEDFFNRPELWGSGNTPIKEDPNDIKNFNSPAYDFIKSQIGNERVGAQHYNKLLGQVQPRFPSTLPKLTNLGSDINLEQKAKDLVGHL